MHIIESVKMAVTTLTANKLRSSLTMFGMIIGNASVIAMIGIGQGAQNYTLEKLESFGQNRLVVFVSSEEIEGFIAENPTLVLSDAEAIATQAPSVKAVAPLIGSRLLISYRSRRTQTSVTGTTPGSLYVRNAQVARGRFFDQFEQQQNAQVVALGSDVASKLFGSDNPSAKRCRSTILPLK
jgi:putative ABC transport system permease protein